MSLIRAQAPYVQIGTASRMNCADWAAAAVLHEQYLEDVFRYVLRRVPRWEEAQDIIAQVFAAALAGLPRFRGQCSPYLWLLGIARRQIAVALRQRAARRETLASELTDGVVDADPLRAALAAAEGPMAALMRAEAQRVLHELVAQLTADQREALMLHYMELLSVADIAVVMGRSATSVKGLIQRARATVYRLGRDYFLGDERQKP